jgi:hypothetical protein
MTSKYAQITMTEVNNRIYNQAKREADKWFVEQCHNVYAAYYLYVKPSTESQWGELILSTELPSTDFVLASPDRISPANTIESVIYRIKEIAQRQPIVPYGN